MGALGFSPLSDCSNENFVRSTDFEALTNCIAIFKRIVNQVENFINAHEYKRAYAVGEIPIWWYPVMRAESPELSACTAILSRSTERRGGTASNDAALWQDGG